MSPSRRRPRPSPRALSALQAFGRGSSEPWQRIVDRRGSETLYVDERPHEVFNKAGDLVGVGFVVRLFRRGREVPIDGHRLIINPPGLVPDGDGFRPDPLRAGLDAVWDSVKAAPNPQMWRKPRGTVTTVYAGTSDGFLLSSNATYSTARAGGTLAANDSGNTIQVGQTVGFAIYEAFLHFDLSSIGTDTVTAADIDLYLTTDLSSTDFVTEARTHSWTGSGLTTGDWVAGASLGALTLLATLDSNGIGSTGAYKTMTAETALLTACMTGSVELVLASSRQRNNNQPSGLEYLIFSSADESGTTQDPKITVTHFPGPLISSVTPSIVQDGQAGVVIDGSTFGVQIDDAKLELGSTNDHDTATLVTQSVTSWGDEELIWTVSRGGLGLGARYLFVTDSTGRVSPGFPITLAAPPEITGVTPPSIEDGMAGVVFSGLNFLSDQGTGKLELIDGLDYTTATKVLQTITNWTANALTATIVRDDLPFAAWAVATADNGLRSAPFAVSFGDPPPATDQGWTQIVLYGSPAVGSITKHRGLEIHEMINGAGYAKWTSPLDSADVALATLSRKVTIEREGEGEIWPGPGCRGRIALVEPREIEGTGTFEVDFVAVGEPDEIGGEPIYASLPVLGASVQQAADLLVENTEEPWTVVVSGSGYEPVTKVWGFTNVLPALKELAEIANAYWRPVPASRTIEIKNFHSSSGLLLTNSPNATTQSQAGQIASIPRKTHERPIVNAIQPYGKTDTDAVFDLRHSTRSTPYPIKSFVRPPFVIDSDRGHLTEAMLIAGNTYKVESLSLESLGFTRGMVVFLAVPTTSSALRLLTANGKEAVNIFTQNVGGWTIAAYLLINPAAGWQKFSAEVTAEQDHTFRAITLDNVLQESALESSLGAVRHVAAASGTSTSPSVDVNSDPDDLVIDFLLLPSYSSGAVTPGSGQALISPQSTVLVTGWSTKRLGASPTRTMSWTLGTSQAWILAAMSIKPYANLYIEDETSIATHGRHFVARPMGTFRVPDSSSYEEAANTMFDAAADDLTNGADGQWHLELDMAFVPGHPLNWLPGDTVDVDYVSPQLTIQEVGLIVTERVQLFDDAGVRHWRFDTSNKPVLRPRTLEALKRLQERMAAAQANQV